MLALKIEFLMGRYIATRYNDRYSSEWPPHPARVFSALVATFHDRDPVDPDERTALEWLQVQGPPEIAASDATKRDVREHFVWPNDASVFGADAEDLYAAERKVQETQATLDAAAGLGRSKRDLRGLEKELRDALQERASAERRLATDTRDATETALRVLRLSAKGRQSRTFPSVTPQEPVVHFIWPAAEPGPTIRTALARLVARLTRIGHSSSLVVCTLVDAALPATWVPDENGPLILRVPTTRQLDLLEEQYERHRGVETRVLPWRAQRYRHPTQAAAFHVPASVFGEDWVVYERVSGPPFPLTRAVDAARALRGALMKHAEEQPPPEVLAGHTPDGNRSERPHVAFLALPYVGHSRADGTLLGVATVLPRELPEEDRLRVYRAFAHWEKDSGRRLDDETVVELWMGRAGAWTLRRRAATDGHPRNLDPEVWVGRPYGARYWGSVTPVVLDRYPGNLRSHHPDAAARAYLEAQETIAEACLRIGLPRPYRVEILSVSPVAGAPPAASFPPFLSHPGESARMHVHVRIEFAEPVRGPVILGAGRYRGLGLCRPLREEDVSQ